jgi:ribosomal protein L29
MKTTDELRQMLFERIAEVKSGELTLAYEDQLRHEIALLATILEDDIDAEEWEQIEACM